MASVGFDLVSNLEIYSSFYSTNLERLKDFGFVSSLTMAN